jgi:hypothetical protein
VTRGPDHPIDRSILGHAPILAGRGGRFAAAARAGSS